MGSCFLCKRNFAFQLRQRLSSPPPQVSGARWVVSSICGSVQGLHRKRTNRLDRDLQEETYYGNWLTQWWRLRSSTVCPLQVGESQKPVQHSLSLTACGGGIISNSPKVRESELWCPRAGEDGHASLRRGKGNSPFLHFSVLSEPSMDWMVPTNIAEDGSSLLFLLIQRLISFRSTITDTPEMIFYPCLGTPWPKSSWYMKLMNTGPIRVTRWRNVLWPEDSTIRWKTCFPMELSWHPCWKPVYHKHMGLFLGSIVFHPSICLSWLWYQAVLVLQNLLKLCVKCFKSGGTSLPDFFFFLKIILAILVPLHFHMNFKLGLKVSAKWQLGFWQELHWICGSIWGSIVILTTVSLPISECGMSLHLFMHLFPSFNKIL